MTFSGEKYVSGGKNSDGKSPAEFPRWETRAHEHMYGDLRRNAANILMKPNSLGNFAQAKYDERNEEEA